MAAMACCVAGCSPQTQRQTPPPSDVRDLTVQEEIDVERAEQRLVKACMKRKGYPYWEMPVPGVDERKVGGYVTDDVAWAKKYGYGRFFEERSEEIRRTHPTTIYQNKLRPEGRAAFTRALDGDSGDRVSTELPGGLGTVNTPRGGCANEARTKLYEDAEAWFVTRKTIEGILPLYGQDLLEDTRFTKSVAKWSRCMKEAGRPFGDPARLRQNRMKVTEEMSSARAYKFDKGLAVLDATCAKKTSLGKTLRTLEASYREKVLEQYEKEEDDYRRMRLHALRQAKDVLA